MSLILEALRKSEAERRRGQAPDLRTELPPVAPSRARDLPRWSWVVFAVALLALAWLLLLARPGAAPPLDPPPTAADAVPPAGPATTARHQAGTVPPRPRTVIDPVPAPPQDVPEPRRQQPAPATPAPAIASGSGPAPGGSGEKGAGAASSLPPPPPAAAPTPPQTIAPDARLLALSDLSTDERRQLPPLKLSMHMWSQDPARRFVILDGQRLVEGDRAGPAVVDAIRSDDVVLAWNGMRLRLSMR